MMTIRELWEREIKSTTNRWISNITPLNYIYTASGYQDNHAKIDRYFTNKYGDLIINEKIIDPSDNLITQIMLESESVLYSNIENIKRVWEINLSEYNPVENYDKIETLDKVEVKNEIGERNRTSTDDKTTQTQYTTGYNEDASSFFTPESKFETSGQGSNGSVVNKIKDQNTTDTTTTSGTGDGGKIENRVHGNVGVTEATTMLEHHADFWSHYNFFDYIFKLTFDNITIGVYKSEV